MKKGEYGKQLRIKVLKYNDTRAEKKLQMSETQNCGIETQEPQYFALAEPKPDPEPDLEPDLDPGRT